MYSILESNNNFFLKEEKEKSWVIKRKVKSQVTSKLPRTKYKKRLVLVKTAVNCGLGGVWNPLHLTPNWERSRVQNNDC